MKKAISLLLAMTMLLALAGCGSQSAGSGSAPAPSDTPVQSTPEPEDTPTSPLDLSGREWVYNETYGCYALENVVYCTAPLDEAKQSMNIYVPAAYLNEDGTLAPDGTAGDYTAETAPIIYENGVAGYMEAMPNPINDTSAAYLQRGYVYVSVGSRGRGTQAEDGTYIGKSPAGLVDLKAGVRLLKANDAVLPGSSERIISIGASAGGAMSALLGSTGNSANYIPYLEEMGAVMDATDDVYAAMCYCPITDIENADAAYEWMYQNDLSYEGFMAPPGELTGFQQALSAILAQSYVEAWNSKGVKDPATGEVLELGEDGRSGSAYDYLMGVLENAATKYITKLQNGELGVDYGVEEYLTGDYVAIVVDPFAGTTTEVPGTNKTAWLSWDGTRASITSLEDFVANYQGRLKCCLAFDDLEYMQAENEELGDAATAAVHFDSAIAPAIEQIKEDFPEEYARYYDGYAAVEGDEALAMRKYLLNPFNYIGTDEVCDTAPYYRIRLGTQDGHTSFTVAMSLALKLMECEDTEVDYAMVWDWGHGPADYAGEFCDWVDSIC